MRTPKDFGRRAVACVLAATMTLSTVPAVAARDAILGTIAITGTAFASTPTTDWVKITGTRPLVSGDRFMTDSGARLVADFSELGIVGLYADSEVFVVEKGADVAVEARRGKVAFYFAPNSRLKLTAGGATIETGARKAEGYVEFNEHGIPQLFVESDDVSVVPAGGTAIVFVRGDRIMLTEPLAKVPAEVATVDDRKSGAMEPPAQRKRIGGISPLGWTAIGAAVAAVGIGVGIGVSGGGGGDGGDTNGSE